MSLLRTLAQSTRVGNPTQAGPLTVIPLFGPALSEPDYLTLSQAVKDNLVTISEVSESGSVPVLRAMNHGARPVLLVDGEELIGAKQNRILNLSILLPPHRVTDIPVSCVEQGRWHYRSRHFSPSDNTLYPAARGRKVAQVSSAIRHGARSADQGALWTDLHSKAGRLGTASATGAMKDMYEGQLDRVRRLVARFLLDPEQTGAAFALGGRVKGVELFDCPRTFAEYFPKLIRSWGMDALEMEDSQERRAESWEAMGMLTNLAESPVEAFPAAGLGEDLRLGYQNSPAAALAYQGRVVHLVGYSL